jgi:hypothetical protein
MAWRERRGPDMNVSEKVLQTNTEICYEGEGTCLFASRERVPAPAISAAAP